MTENPTVEIPVEPEMLEAIDIFCARTDIDRTELLVWALSKGFELFAEEFNRREAEGDYD